MKTSNYIDENFNNYIEELKNYLKIPSISADSNYNSQTRLAADFTSEMLKNAGMENVAIMETDGNPVVYADWLHAEGKQTVLIYGHYDVQPPDPLNLWTSPAFEAEVRGEHIFARGSIDDKGQVHMHIKSVEALIKTEGKLPVNVKFIIEGEEEIGSPSLVSFLEKNKELLSCNSVMISDTTMHDYNMPSLTYGLRGLAYLELHVYGPNRDLHSGMFGGAIVNPLNALCKMVANMKDENERISIPGFYDDVVEVSEEEHKELARLPYNVEDFKNLLEIKTTNGEKGYTDLERLWARPTLDLCGIWGGYQGEGAKTVLPSKASAKISMRLVANQDYKKVYSQFNEFIKSNTPIGVTVEVIELHGGPPALTPTDSIPMKAALNALRLAFNTEPYLIRSGGSIPIVADFERVLNAPVVLMGFGLPDQNAHSPNENMHLPTYLLGIKSCYLFLEEYSKY
ncbi:MAG: dipeptidase [Chlorobiota bacterium]|nr:dipeptidase [Chlorobiota bacterium]QQS66036.1 MAG: dipeptidase [Chlorobiota bacterium]